MTFHSAIDGVTELLYPIALLTVIVVAVLSLRWVPSFIYFGALNRAGFLGASIS